MLVLTEKVVDGWKLPVSFMRRKAGEFVQEKHGIAGPSTMFLMMPGFAGVFMLVFGMLDMDWKLGLSGAGILAVLFGVLLLAGSLAQPFFEARHKAINDYLDGFELDKIIDQAVGLGPGYLGRRFLFDHLDERSPGWSADNLERLTILVRAEELPNTQRSSIQYYLNTNHPGWSSRA